MLASSSSTNSSIQFLHKKVIEERNLITKRLDYGK